jgi:predicted glycogen debranching enzyme
VLLAAVQAILERYAEGTRFGIRADDDGLLAAGAPGVALTWMDARVGGAPVTPRIGKPVEVQALWIAALRASAALDPRWRRIADRAADAFHARFWNPAAGCLYDVIDVDGRPGATDGSVRPNQILAVGGLPEPLLDGERAAAVVEVVERMLLTPIGLRTLAPGSPGYAPRYRGSPEVRDGAYHQGPAWPWLLAPFVEAWIRVRGDTPENRAIARQRFFDPLDAHLDTAGLGHVSELADAEPPFAPDGCPFQAWSVAAAIRIDRTTCPPSDPAARRRAR